jgi:hypothetical protein
MRMKATLEKVAHLKANLEETPKQPPKNEAPLFPNDDASSSLSFGTEDQTLIERKR